MKSDTILIQLVFHSLSMVLQKFKSKTIKHEMEGGEEEVMGEERRNLLWFQAPQRRQEKRFCEWKILHFRDEQWQN